MKTIVSLILFLIVLGSYTTVKAASIYSQENVSTPLYPEDPDPDKPEPSQTPRDLAEPVICEIDFEANTIAGASLPDDVAEYQIWDASATMCLSISTDAATFVEALKSLPTGQTYIIRLITPAVTLSGTIYLE